jgi:hypothetical protein
MYLVLRIFRMPKDKPLLPRADFPYFAASSEVLTNGMVRAN